MRDTFEGLRFVSSVAIWLYACAAWLSTFTAKAVDGQTVPIGHIVRTTGCLIAAYIGHRAICSFTDGLRHSARAAAPTLAGATGKPAAHPDGWLNRPANQDPDI